MQLLLLGMELGVILPLVWYYLPGYFINVVVH